MAEEKLPDIIPLGGSNPIAGEFETVFDPASGSAVVRRRSSRAGGAAGPGQKVVGLGDASAEGFVRDWQNETKGDLAGDFAKAFYLRENLQRLAPLTPEEEQELGTLKSTPPRVTYPSGPYMAPFNQGDLSLQRRTELERRKNAPSMIAQIDMDLQRLGTEIMETQAILDRNQGVTAGAKKFNEADGFWAKTKAFFEAPIDVAVTKASENAYTGAKISATAGGVSLATLASGGVVPLATGLGLATAGAMTANEGYDQSLLEELIKIDPRIVSDPKGFLDAYKKNPVDHRKAYEEARSNALKSGLAQGAAETLTAGALKFVPPAKTAVGRFFADQVGEQAEELSSLFAEKGVQGQLPTGGELADTIFSTAAGTAAQNAVTSAGGYAIDKSGIKGAISEAMRPRLQVDLDTLIPLGQPGQEAQGAQPTAAPGIAPLQITPGSIVPFEQGGQQAATPTNPTAQTELPDVIPLPATPTATAASASDQGLPTTPQAAQPQGQAQPQQTPAGLSPLSPIAQQAFPVGQPPRAPQGPQLTPTPAPAAQVPSPLAPQAASAQGPRGNQGPQGTNPLAPQIAQAQAPQAQQAAGAQAPADVGSLFTPPAPAAPTQPTAQAQAGAPAGLPQPGAQIPQAGALPAPGAQAGAPMPGVQPQGQTPQGRQRGISLAPPQPTTAAAPTAAPRNLTPQEQTAWANLERKAAELDRRREARRQQQGRNTNPDTRNRGPEQIAMRLINELRSGGTLTLQEANGALRIVEKLMENGYLDNLAVSVSNAQRGAGVRGDYNPVKELVQLFVRNTNRPGVFKRTFAHEVSHHLERMVPAKDLEAARQQFLRERAKWLSDKKGIRALLGDGNWLDRSFTNEQIRDFLAKNQMDPALISKYFIRDTNTGRWRIKLTDETYRYTNFSEYFAEKVAQIAGDRDDNRANNQANPGVWAKIRGMLAQIKKAMIEVFGRDEVEAIWDKFQQGEYSSEFQRDQLQGYDNTGGQNPVQDNLTTSDYRAPRVGPADAGRQGRVEAIDRLEPNRPIQPPQSARLTGEEQSQVDDMKFAAEQMLRDAGSPAVQSARDDEASAEKLTGGFESGAALYITARQFEGLTREQAWEEILKKFSGNNKVTNQAMKAKEAIFQIVDSLDGLPVSVAFEEGSKLASTRYPDAASATENPNQYNLQSDISTVYSNPLKMRDFAASLKKVSGFRYDPSMTDRQIIDSFINHVKANLLHMHDSVPEQIRQRSKLWYVGANLIAKRLSNEHGVSHEAAAGVLAVLSPQMDWYKNVSLAERAMDIIINKSGHAVDDRMIQVMKSRNAIAKIALELKETKAGIPKEERTKYPDDKDNGRRANKIRQMARDAVDELGLAGQKIGEIKVSRLQAIAVRAYDEAYNPRSYEVITPEGNKGGPFTSIDGEDSEVGWGGFGTIEKVFSIINDQSLENISRQLGGEHKVRNFYNNIIDPDARNGQVTIDTHAVAAALMEPLSGEDPEVKANLGGAGGSAMTGLSGLYPIYAHAYAEAARARGILPREMQSITWEAVRGLFTATYKTNEENITKIKSIWDSYKSGEIDIAEARARIEREAGGYNDPTWHRPDGQSPEGARPGSNQGQLGGPELGQDGERADARRKGGDTGGSPVRSARDDGENTPIPGGYREAFFQAKKGAGAPEPKQIKWWTDVGHDVEADKSKQFLWAVDRQGQLHVTSVQELEDKGIGVSTFEADDMDLSGYERMPTHLDWAEQGGPAGLLSGPAHGRIDATGDVVRISLIQKSESSPQIKAETREYLKGKLADYMGESQDSMSGYDFTDAGPFTGPEVFSARDEDGADVPRPSRRGSFKAFDEMVTGREISKPADAPHPYNLKRFTFLSPASKTARANLDGYHLVQQGSDNGTMGKNEAREFRVFSKELEPGTDSPVHEYRIRFRFEPRGPGSAAGGVTVLFTDEGGMEDTTPDRVKIGLISELFERARQAGITDVFVSRDYAGEIDPNELGLFGHVAKTEPEITFSTDGRGYNGYGIDRKTAYSARDEDGENTVVPGGKREEFLKKRKAYRPPYYTEVGHDPANAENSYLFMVDPDGVMHVKRVSDLQSEVKQEATFDDQKGNYRLDGKQYGMDLNFLTHNDWEDIEDRTGYGVIKQNRNTAIAFGRIEVKDGKPYIAIGGQGDTGSEIALNEGRKEFRAIIKDAAQAVIDAGEVTGVTQKAAGLDYSFVDGGDAGKPAAFSARDEEADNADPVYTPGGELANHGDKALAKGGFLTRQALRIPENMRGYFSFAFEADERNNGQAAQIKFNGKPVAQIDLSTEEYEDGKGLISLDMIDVTPKFRNLGLSTILQAEVLELGKRANPAVDTATAVVLDPAQRPLRSMQGLLGKENVDVTEDTIEETDPTDQFGFTDQDGNTVRRRMEVQGNVPQYTPEQRQMIKDIEAAKADGDIAKARGLKNRLDRSVAESGTQILSARDEEPAGKKFVDHERLFLEVDAGVDSLYSPTAKKNLPNGAKIQFESLDEGSYGFDRDYGPSDGSGKGVGAYKMTVMSKDGDILAEAHVIADTERVFSKRPKYLDNKIQRREPKLEEGWAMTVEMIAGDDARAQIAVAAEAVERAKMAGATMVIVPFKGWDRREAVNQLISKLEGTEEVQINDEIDALNVVFKQNTPDYASAEDGDAAYGIRRDRVYSARDEDYEPQQITGTGDLGREEYPVDTRMKVGTDNLSVSAGDEVNLLESTLSPERKLDIKEFVKDSVVKIPVYRGHKPWQFSEGAYEEIGKETMKDGFYHVTPSADYASSYVGQDGKLSGDQQSSEQAVVKGHINVKNVLKISRFGNVIESDDLGMLADSIVKQMSAMGADANEVRRTLNAQIGGLTNYVGDSLNIWEVLDRDSIRDLFDKHGLDAIEYMDSTGMDSNGVLSYALRDRAKFKSTYGPNRVDRSSTNMFQSARDEEPAVGRGTRAAAIGAAAALTPTTLQAATGAAKAGVTIAGVAMGDLIGLATGVALTSTDRPLRGLNPIAANMHLLANDTKSPTLKRIANMFGLLGGNTSAGAQETYHDSRDSSRRIFRNKLAAAFEPLAKLSQDQIRALDVTIARALAGEIPMPSGAVGQVVQNLQALSDELYNHLREAGVDVNYAKDYAIPHSFNAEAVAKDEQAFIDAAEQAYIRNNPDRIRTLTGYMAQIAAQAKASGWTAEMRDQSAALQAEIDKLHNANPRQQAEDLAAAILSGEDGGDQSQGLLLGSNPQNQNKADFLKGRVFESAARAMLREYFQNDPRHAWNNYIARATTISEFSRRFGKDGGKWNDMVQKMRAEKVSNEDITRIKELVLDAMGALTPAARGGHAMANALLGLSNMSKLKSTFLTNFLEAQAQAIPGGLLDTVTAPVVMLKEFAAVLAELTPRQRALLKRLIRIDLNTETGNMELARIVGLMDASGVHQIMENSAYNLDRSSDFREDSRTDRAARGVSNVTSGLARAYGIEASENAKRAMGARYASGRLDQYVSELIRDNIIARALAKVGYTKDTFTTKNEARMRLRRAGVADADMAAFTQWWEKARASGKFNEMLADSTDPMAAKARRAIRMESSRAMVNSNRAMKPGGERNKAISQDNFWGKAVMSFLNYPAAFREQVAKPMARDIRSGVRGFESEGGESTFFSPAERARMIAKVAAIPAMAVSAAAFLALRTMVNGDDEDKEELQKKGLFSQLIDGLSYTGFLGGKTEAVQRARRGQLPPIVDEGVRLGKNLERESTKSNGKERAVTKSVTRSIGVPALQVAATTALPMPLATVIDQALASKAFTETVVDIVAGPGKAKSTGGSSGSGRESGRESGRSGSRSDGR